MSDNASSEETHQEAVTHTLSVLSQMHEKNQLRLMQLTAQVHDAIQERHLLQETLRQQKLFEKFCDNILETQMKQLRESGKKNSNFEYIYQSNKQGRLLYPPVFSRLEKSQPLIRGCCYPVTQWIEPHDRYILRSPDFDKSLDAEEKHKIQNVVDKFFKEGTLEQPSMLDNPFAIPMVYLGLGAAFFWKFYEGVTK